MKKTKRISCRIILTLLTVLFAVPAFAQGGLTVDIYGPGQRQANFTMLPSRSIDGGQLNDLAGNLKDRITDNLAYLPFLVQRPETDLLGGDPSTGIKINEVDFKPLQLSKVDLVMTTGWEGDKVQLRVFGTYSQRLLVGKVYSNVTSNTLPDVADMFCSALVEALTGKRAFFQSPIAFVRTLKNSKEIYTILPQGRDKTRITRLGGYNLSPAWSDDGSRIVFTHIGRAKHTLGMWDAKTRTTLEFTSGLGTTVISPVFTPDGTIAVTLNRSGQSDIYKLDSKFRPDKPVVSGPYIDVSPSFDRAGRYMAFTSGRAGTPQVYLKDMVSGKIKRITIKGSYNTHPCVSPDGRYIAYNGLTGDGHRIFVFDRETGKERQISFGPGNDEYPAFGPDGYFLAFSSSRSGEYKLYLSTRHGDPAKMINTGSGAAFAPAWDTSNR